MKIYSYNTSFWNFKHYVRKALNIYNLEKIDCKYDVFDEVNDQTSKLHQQWYNFIENDPDDYGFHQDFMSRYRDFVKNVVADKLDKEPILYQTKPTFRCHLQGNVAVGAFHRDRDYNHNPKEINVFLPITRAFGNNTFWIESEEGKEDFKPVVATYGNFVMFDGANLQHGNHINDTNITRVSFDFRILRVKDYEAGKKSVTRSVPMEVGGYWSELQ